MFVAAAISLTIDQTLLKCVDALPRLLPKDTAKTLMKRAAGSARGNAAEFTENRPKQRLRDWHWG
jgi:hypothetical protein